MGTSGIGISVRIRVMADMVKMVLKKNLRRMVKNTMINPGRFSA